MEKTELLKNIPVFALIGAPMLDIVAGAMEKVALKEGALIFDEGAVADSFYIVEKGEVVITKNLKAGREKTLAVIKSGAVFGEMAFFSDSPRIAAARSLTQCDLWRLPRDKFFDVIDKHPKEGLKIFSGLLQVAMDRLEQTSRELATIYETGRIISSGKSLGEISSAIADELLVSVPSAEKAAVYFYNEFNEEFESPKLPETAASSEFVGALSGSAAGIVASAAAPGRAEIAGSSDHFALPPFLARSRALAAVPIGKPSEKKSVPAGFIVLWNETPAALSAPVFFNTHLLLLSSVAGQLAEALANLRHHEEELNRQRLGRSKNY